MAHKKSPDNRVCTNRRASYNYEILDTLECGIVLVGSEVKSLREKAGSIEEAYARIERDELWLIDSHISPYKFGLVTEHEAKRRRKLLVHTREIRKLKPKLEQKGFTLIPLQIHFNTRGVAKVLLALVRGKRMWDRRQDQKAREHRREMAAAMRRRR